MRPVGNLLEIGLKNLAKDFLKPNSVMAELGVFKGDSTLIFLNTGCVSKLYAIDPWKPGYDPIDPTSNLSNFDGIEETFKERMKPFLGVVILKMTGDEAAEHVPDNSLDFLYIDAVHQEKNLRQDIQTWLTKIKDGGAIAGHDYDFDPQIGQNYPGVKMAVDGMFGKPDGVYCDGSWVKIL